MDEEYDTDQRSDSASDFEYEDDSDTDSPPATFDDIQKSKNFSMNLRPRYARKWTEAEAFREIYQNCVDGVVKSSGVSHSQLKTKFSEDKNQILVEILHPRTEQVLAYCKFKHKAPTARAESFGTLEVTNFHAKLERQALAFGGTTKESDSSQAGEHGEGLKMAALIFTTHDYSCRVQSSGFNCRFRLDGIEELICKATRMTEKMCQTAKAKGAKTPGGLHADPCQDVSVFVGESGVPINQKKKITSEKISLEKFRGWLKVALDINPPDMVRTRYGDLILDPAYKNMNFIKGLMLRGSGLKDRQMYGYNFPDGQTARDRTMLENGIENAKNINRIWAEIIAPENGYDKRQELIEAYCQLFLGHINKYDDVSMVDFRKWLDPKFVGHLWVHLREKDPDVFYYSEAAGKHQELGIIQLNLKRTPKQLKRDVWEVLKWGLTRLRWSLRTPQEEQCFLFSNAPRVNAPHVDELEFKYFQNLEWMLQCCKIAYPNTQPIEFEFVDGGHLNIDTVYHNSRWKIHKKWLTKMGAHEKIFCQDQYSDDAKIFPCCHAIFDLWEHMALQVEKPRDQDERFLHSKIRAQIYDTPRGVGCSQISKGEGLRITWNQIRGGTRPLRVVLHTAQCPESRLHLNPESNPAVSYVPQVSTLYKDAFVALPPPPTQPRPRATGLQQSNTNGAPNRANKRSFEVGDMLKTGDLDWEGTFPGSHQFYHAEGESSENVYIAVLRDSRKKTKSG
ncbi:hypothetical protein DM02DRAFT_724687 [Periconia macrospinosa]|uniref:Uncharacterized protein n=1 Tax=Periconia macrospinosa TaxID=97972 RepID=A0A2V1E9B0_9PLEO|nr:hypothetical protein DM02DRAFT_724687 [Periconia macrospinosa]